MFIWVKSCSQPYIEAVLGKITNKMNSNQNHATKKSFQIKIKNESQICLKLI